MHFLKTFSPLFIILAIFIIFLAIGNLLGYLEILPECLGSRDSFCRP